MSKFNGRKGTAVSNLTHYLQEAFEAGGLPWSADNDIEVEEIVDSIVSEAKYQIQEGEKQQEFDPETTWSKAKFVAKHNELKALKKKQKKLANQVADEETKFRELARELYENLPIGYHQYGANLIHVTSYHRERAYVVEDFYCTEEDIIDKDGFQVQPE